MKIKYLYDNLLLMLLAFGLGLLSSCIERNIADDKTIAFVKENNKWGVINNQGRQLVPCKYDKLDYFTSIENDLYFKVAKKQADSNSETNDYAYGLINSKGKMILNIEFEEIRYLSDDLLSVKQDNKWGFKNKNNKWITKPLYEAVGFYQNGLVGVMKNQLWGFVDNLGQLIIPHQFAASFSFENDHAVVRDNSTTKLWGLIDKKGDWVFPPNYNKLFYLPLKDLYFAASNTEKGYLDLENKFVKTLPYAIHEQYYNGYATIIREDSNGVDYFGFMNIHDEIIIPPNFIFVRGFDRQGIAPIKSKDTSHYTLIDTTGTEIANVPSFLDGFSEKLLRIKFPNGLYGFVNLEGKQEIAPVFDEAKYFIEDYAAVKKADKWGFINKDGTWLLEPRYEAVVNFFEDLAAIKVQNEWGFINKNGTIIIKPQYENIQPFSGTLAGAKDEKKWGFINKNGDWLIQPEYDTVKQFVTYN